MVFEHHGRWGKSAILLLEQLAKRVGTTLPGITRGQFRDYWLKRLGCELQKGMVFSVVHNAEGWHRSNPHVEELRLAIFDHV